MRINRLMSISIIFTMLFTSFSAFAAPKMPEPIFDITEGVITEKYSPDDKVTLIVEVEGDPVLAGTEAALMGTDYIDSDNGQEKASKILGLQCEIMDSINENIAEDIEPVSTYSLLFNGFAIETSYGNMEDIMNIPGVKNVYVSEDIKIEPFLSKSAGMISSLPQDVTPYSGKGQAVAIIDSEFNVNHEFFRTAPANPKYSPDDIEELIETQGLKANVVAGEVYISEKIPFAYDYYNQSYDVYSTVGVHGSHVAGIIGGKNGKAADGTTINGVAPDCQLILMKVTSKSGAISETAMFDALEDAVKLGVNTVNCSIGTNYTSPSNLPVWEQNFNNAYNAGVFISVAAGNLNRGFYKDTPLTANTDYSATGLPAGFSNITAVASAVNTNTSDVTISSFSSYGVTENLELKPEITAPGGSIYSSVPNNSYATKNGTSMAAPHITGAALIINEYLDNTNPDITGTERIQLIENLLMSTAVAATNPTSGVPYSPRVQGAGLANVAAAVKTPAIITGATDSDSGLITTGYNKTKINLGDELSDSFNVAFTVKNLSNEMIVYDKISLNVLADGYKVTSGKYYVADSINLDVVSHTLPETITLNAGSSVKVTAQINLDQTQLSDIGDIYTNGFFIDGFISLATEDESIPAIGVPFTGFYGDWTKAPVFDTTKYDEGESYLVSSENNVGGTLLYTKIGSSSKILGHNGKDGYDSEYIALSPNGDGYHEELLIQLTPMRTLSEVGFFITNSEGTKTHYSRTANLILNKFYSQSLGISDISFLDDGDYELKLKGTYNYSKTNPTSHHMQIPFYVDRNAPEIIKAVPSDGKLEVTFRDNRHIAYVYTYYEDASGNVHSDKKYIEKPVMGEDVTVSFDLADISASSADYEDIYIFAHDMAENYYVNSVSCLMGDIHPIMSDFNYSSNVLGVTFDFTSYKDTQNCSMILAFYDDNGSLVHISNKNNVNLPKGDSSHTFAGVADLTDATKCRLFIWNDMDSLIPADTAKDFDISAELG